MGFVEGEALESDAPTAMVVMPPDMGESILGNRGGFLRLAIATARAAQGQNQNLNKQPWVCHEDVDWQIEGLSYAEYAHIHLPEKPTKSQRTRQNAFVLSVISLLMGCV